MTTTSTLSRRAVLGATALLVLGLAGCGTSPSTPSEVRVVAVTAATDRQARPTLGQAGTAAVRAAAESDRGTFTLMVAGAPERTAILDLTPRREVGTRSEVEHGPRRAELLQGAVVAAEVMVGSAAPTGGRPDLLGAVAEAARGTPGTLVVADSGISTTDPVDLRTLGWEGEPAAIVENLRRANQLPDLRGWDVLLVGLGRAGGGQTTPGTAQERWLESFWTTVCTSSGARSCRVETVSAAPVPAAPGIRTTALVPVPAARTELLPGGGTQVSLPDSVLGFAPGAATPGPAAAAALGPVVAAYRAHPGPVRVRGYVAYWGDERYRADLSRARAVAVAHLLASAGVRPGDLTAEGLGAVDGPAASTTDGRFDEAKVVAAGLRRVVVTVGDHP